MCRDLEREDILFICFASRLIVFEQVECFFDDRDSFQLGYRLCHNRQREDVGRGDIARAMISLSLDNKEK